MNELSWLIYLAGVSGSIGIGLGIVFVLSLFVLAGTLIAVPVSEGDVLSDDSRPGWFKTLKTTIAIAVTAFLVGSFVPSRETIYAIAASEMGEKVMASETYGKAVEALNAWLDRQIAGKPTQ